MTRYLLVLMLCLAGLCGQPLLAAEDEAADSAGSDRVAGQETAPNGSGVPDSAKQPAGEEDEEPECD